MNNYYFSKKNLEQDETSYDGYLLKELSKLKNSSIEPVDDFDLSEFKKYLHVDRSIQGEFYDAVTRAAKCPSSHLVMICASSGDGKNHLIANLKKDNFDLFKQFIIIPDASESYDYDKNEIETLASKLEYFKDENIHTSTEKVILGINLGVLNKFLVSSYAKEEYKELKSKIEKYNIFESDNVSENILEDKFTLITFSDYNIFELNDDEDSNFTSSKYISDLLNKITQNDVSNPFYKAYDKDRKRGYIHPVIYNYEMLMQEEVQKTIIDYLIKIFIKYKKIIPTRELLNFIHDILVPPESLKREDLNINDYMNYLLPNLLFGSQRSDLLKLLNELDPTLYRSESIDKFIIDLNIKDNTEKILDTYFDVSRFNLLKEYGEYLKNFKQLENSEKEKATNTLIRFAVFYGKSNIKDTFKDEVYLKYLRYLYAYNRKSVKGYWDLFNEIREAIFNWKGSNDYKTICIGVLDSFGLYKNLNFEIVPDTSQKQLLDDSDNRFKTSIKVNFSLGPNEKPIPLNVDFSLYEYIIKLYNGFKPNQSDRENLIVLDELINNLLSKDQNCELNVVSLDRNKRLDGDKRFLLKYKYGVFEFREESQQ